jgi:hypothetical protein
MRIESNRQIRTATSRRDEKARNAASGEFAELIQTEAPAQPAAATAPGAVAGLVALQELGDATTRRRQAVARGAQILDELDEVRRGLLAGSLDAARLGALARTVRAARVAADDPGLAAVLDEIELRAHVELAKLSLLD